MKNIKATKESIKEHNIGLILKNIKEEEQITRSLSNNLLLKLV